MTCHIDEISMIIIIIIIIIITDLFIVDNLRQLSQKTKLIKVNYKRHQRRTLYMK